jgi:two-component system CheB/CheR fusion protein
MTMPRKKRPLETPPDSRDPVLPAVNPVVSHENPSESLPFPVVAIGASAGGLEAINRLLAVMPPDTGLAFVVIQHLLPTRDSMLTDILARATRMPVRQVEDKMPIEPDTVYVIPPGKDLVMGQGMLQLAPRTELRGQHRPVDHFMRSLAEEHGHKSIGVVLSGTGYDGSLGIQELKAAGGITFAQDSTADQAGMPRAAIATGAVDLVLPPEEIGREIARIARHPYVRPEMQQAAARHEASMQRVLAMIRDETGVEFSGYKRNTINRRVARRMLLHRLDGLPEYVEFLQSHPGEVGTLYNDLLINVTSFFRNPEAYEALKASVFPRLTEQRPRHESVRVWALGCSTGEEAYSLAMAFSEYAEESNRRVGVQIFATDLNGAGIERARTGLYTKGITQDVSPERLRKFFVEVDGAYRVVKPIRDMCVFARQNVVADPPFSRLDLVACRNMLIYMEPGLQQRVIPTLHYALRDTGYLWLGGSETVGNNRDLFDLVDARNKIYVKKPATRAIPMPAQRAARPAQAPASAPIAEALRSAAMDLQREGERALLGRYSPPSVVVDSELEIVQFRGDTSPFLAHAPGRANMSLVKMLREGLLVPVRAALQRAEREDKVVQEKGLRVRTDGAWREVDVEILPVGAAGGARGFVVAFEEPAQSLKAQARKLLSDAHREAGQVARGAGAGAHEEEIVRLNHEISTMRDYLQSLIERHEAANEELQSANEEVQSANEELQSINEEMETSKEEIQSANEELVTVNDELLNRNEELAASNNDLVNLLASVQMAIIMLSTDLRIRRFTPVAEKLFNLGAGDLGRPLRDIAFNLITPDLERLVQGAIQDVAPVEREVQDRGGRWYALRIRPYRTLENRIDGAVVVLVDIDALKRAERAMEEVDRGRSEFLAVLSHELRNPLASVSNMARLLALPDQDPAQWRHARDIIERQTGNMVRMVDDLLDLARITNGKVELQREPVDLAAVVRASVEASAHERHARAQRLELSIAEEPAWVLVDRLRVDQVMSNLLHNASKFSPRGARIWVSLEREMAPAGPQAVVRVRDEGAGIAPGMLARIFELFVQADERGMRSNAARGIGVGLTLARRLVELHDGAIEAFSPGVGLGSEFTARLPMMAEAPRATAPGLPGHATPPVGAPRRVLIVDDNVDSAESMRMLFRAAGHEIEVVHNGLAAAPAALRFQPHAILLDIGLPDIDGYAVSRQLRGHAELDDTVIIAVTGYGRERLAAVGREAGFDRYLVKPIDTDEAFRLIALGRVPRPA